MINLLSPQTKTDLRYARYNAVLLHYIKVALLIALIVAAEFAAGHWYVNQHITTIDNQIATSKSTVKIDPKLEKEATAINARVASFSSLITAQTKFSDLLGSLAAATPPGVVIDTITLTGDSSKPVRLTATAPSYSAAVGFRDSLAASSSISGADLESVTQQSDNSYKVTITIGFATGKTK